MRKQSKIFYFALFLIIVSAMIISYSMYKIYWGKTSVDENLALWNSIKTEHTATNTEITKNHVYKDGLLGELRIPAVKATIPLLEGSTEKDLEKGAVHYAGTAPFGENGNAIVLGHRDSVFRPLKDLKVKDEIEIETLHGTTTYIIEETKIVKPTDKIITQTYHDPTITLVTCYPFYYFGDAPDRFIAIGKLKKGE